MLSPTKATYVLNFLFHPPKKKIPTQLAGHTSRVSWTHQSLLCYTRVVTTVSQARLLRNFENFDLAVIFNIMHQRSGYISKLLGIHWTVWMRCFFQVFFHIGCALHAQSWVFFQNCQNTDFLLLYYSACKKATVMVIEDILPVILNTKRPLIDIWLLRYKQNSFGCLQNYSELRFFHTKKTPQTVFLITQ